MNILRKTFICSCLFISMLSSLMAQGDVERSAKVRFVCVDVLKHSSKIQLPTGEIAQLSVRHPTKAYKLAVGEDGKVHFYRERVVINEEAVPLATFTIPNGMRNALALLIPLEQKKKYKVVLMNERQFKNGAITLFNMTKVDISLIIDDKNKLLVRARKHSVFDPKADRNVQVQAKMAYHTKEKKWKQFYTSNWSISPTRKEMLILYYHPVSKRIRSKGITEFTNP